MRQLRSLVFIGLFYFWTAVCCLAGVMTFMLPVEKRFGPAKIWSRGTQKILSFVTGTRQELRGMETLPEAPFIIACKHQSTWETTIFQGLLTYPAIILKQEIISVPLLGPYCRLLHMIPVDRKAGPSAMRGMLKAAAKAASLGRPLLIYPEGTRASDRDHPVYQAGIYGLYNHLKIPVIPVALNSAAYWQDDSTGIKPGTIIMECLPAIEPGLGRKEFMGRLTGAIEDACDRLLKLAEATDPEKQEDEGT